MKTLENILEDQPFFKGLAPEYLQFIVTCASNVHFKAEAYLFREGQDSKHFYVLRHGRVALEIFAPGRGAITIQTLGPGDILGWSWLVPPHKKQFSARAVEEVRATAFDGACIRRKCEEDAKLGYELLKRFAAIMGERLQATRLQLLDLYGTRP